MRFAGMLTHSTKAVGTQPSCSSHLLPHRSNPSQNQILSSSFRRQHLRLTNQLISFKKTHNNKLHPLMKTIHRIQHTTRSNHLHINLPCKDLQAWMISQKGEPFPHSQMHPVHLTQEEQFLGAEVLMNGFQLLVVE